MITHSGRPMCKHIVSPYVDHISLVQLPCPIDSTETPSPRNSSRKHVSFTPKELSVLTVCMNNRGVIKKCPYETDL